MTPVPGHKTALPTSEDTLRVELPNGIVVLARENPASPSIFLGGYLHAGQIYEPREKLGLANFVAECLMRGTARHTYNEIFEQLESVGASLGFSALNHTTAFTGKALAEDLGLVLSLTNEILRTATFPPDEVERLRAQILTGLAFQAQSTEAMASLAFHALLAPDHPYGYPIDGTPETVQGITRADLEAFHRQHYGPRGMTVVVAGGVKPEAVVAQVEQILGDWENPAQPPVAETPPIPKLARTTRKDTYVPEKSQADLLLGVMGPERLHPQYLPAMLGNHIFGQFGMMGRIGEVVREREGLAYYAYSGMSGGIGPGPWYVGAGVDPANTEKALKLIRQEVRRFVEEGVTAEELADSQENILGGLPLSLESNAGVVGALLSLERYGLGLDYYRDYEAKLRSITPDAVHAAARAFWDLERLAIAVAGSHVKRNK